MSYQRPDKANRRIQMVRHIVMGLLFIGLTYPLITVHQFGAINLSKTTTYPLAALMALYGLFRIWRGLQELKDHKDDYEEEENNRPAQRY